MYVAMSLTTVAASQFFYVCVRVSERVFASACCTLRRHAQEWGKILSPDAWFTDTTHKSPEVFGEPTAVFISLIYAEGS